MKSSRRERTTTSLWDELGSLEQRKGVFRKRTDENLKLVKGVERSLEKCLERLARAMDALGEGGGGDGPRVAPPADGRGDDEAAPDAGDSCDARPGGGGGGGASAGASSDRTPKGGNSHDSAKGAADFEGKTAVAGSRTALKRN